MKIAELLQNFWKAREEQKIMEHLQQVTPHQIRRNIRLLTFITAVLVVVAIGLSVQVQKRNVTIDRVDRVSSETLTAAREAKEAVDDARRALNEDSGPGIDPLAVARGLEAIDRVEEKLDRLFPEE